MVYKSTEVMSHIESVADHSFLCEALIEEFGEQYPEFFEHFQQPHADETKNTDFIVNLDRMKKLLSNHDLGEIACSDITDDGHADAHEKDANERDVILRYVHKCKMNHKHIAQQTLNDFINFQYPTLDNLYSGWTQFDKKLIQVAKVIDKLEAPLSALENEREGHPGDLRYKESFYDSPLTDQDKKFIKICRSYNPSDVWTAHFVAVYYKFYGFSEAMQVIYREVHEVRGEWFHWWPKLVKRYPRIPDYFNPSKI